MELSLFQWGNNRKESDHKNLPFITFDNWMILMKNWQISHEGKRKRLSKRGRENRSKREILVVGGIMHGWKKKWGY